MAPDALAGFHEPLRIWFRQRFPAPTRAQELAWPLIQAGESALVLAPTGSGKTLAAFLSALDRLLFEPVPEREARCRVLYVSPLKALAVDVERNLRAPLVGVARTAERLGHPFHLPEAALRTGDTPARERALFRRQPADILITTPESLYLLLTTQARAALRSVRAVIVDELHALVGTKRGAHLALSLERLEQLRGARLQRIGLSATVHPVEEAARFLGGFTDEGKPRPVLVADARARKRLDLRVEVPVEDMARPAEPPPPDDDGAIRSGPAAQGPATGAERLSIWPAVHPLILDLVRQHRSTLIFTNSRRLAERLAGALNELAGAEIVRAHHGSIAREQRQRFEEELKAGVLPALVATSSLELGIDMGAIDLVIQVEAPPSVASGLQRIGRAGHRPAGPGDGARPGPFGAASKGVILPKYRGDLLACAALCARMTEGAVEAVHHLRNPLDVLCQQIVAMVSLEDWSVADLSACVRRAAPFAELPLPLLESVLDLLSGRYPADDFAELRPRLTWDRLTGTLHARPGARRVAILSGGTIPDRGTFGVYLAGADTGRGVSARVGELDEEMVLESRPGETFILGATTWRIEEITDDRVLVSPAPGEPGKMPFWRGEQAGRPLEFGRAIGALGRRLRELAPAAARRLLVERHALTERAADNLLAYLAEQEREGVLPDDRTMVAERHLDEMGDHRLCLLSPFGSQVHGPLALCIEALSRERREAELDLLWTDDGIVVRFPGGVEPPPLAELLPDPEEVEALLTRQLAGSALFAARFREAAVRALLLPRRFPGQRTALWQQRRRSADLLRAAARFPSFPIVLEAYRECLRDIFDIPALRELLTDLRRRRVRIVEVSTQRPSPFAAALLYNYAANFLYEGDAPLGERRAQALRVDPQRLRELIGSAALCELIDPEALGHLEEQLQHLQPERRARHADAVHDLLLRLGDLSEAELGARCEARGDALQALLGQLLRERRAIRVAIAGEERYVAAEDAGRYRDALGVPPPPGLPAALLEAARDPLGDLVARYARTHGPFTPAEVAGRLGLGVAPVRAALDALVQSGRVLEGAFRPGRSGVELCDAEVLRQLRQRSLARLRREVEPVEQPALSRLLLSWHGIGSRRRGLEALLEVVEQLQGLALPASALEAEILPARLHRYEPHDLDQLMASGSVVWVGAAPLGEHDGRVRLYLAGHAPLLLPPRPAAGAPAGPLHDRIRAHLRGRGASFFPQILSACGGFSQAVLDALWDLVWAGEVTNDTLQPLRAYAQPRRPQRGRGAGAPSGLGGRLGAHLPVPGEAQGRWALVERLLAEAPSPTERAQALCRQLLQRHGVLTREALAIEEVPGGFSAIYPVLKALEEAGHLRRGYFVAGRGAAQFALPGAAERLRMVRDPEEEMQVAVLSAVDPASAYGAALPWPERRDEDGQREGRRPARAVGALVVLLDGALAAWVARGEQQVVTFLAEVPKREPQAVAAAVARALGDLVDTGRRRVLLLKEVDGRPAGESPLAAALREAGFSPGAQGYQRRPHLDPGQGRGARAG